MIEAVIFDMDGVLIDSEPYWKIAMANVFQTVGVEMSAEKARQTLGLRIREVVEFWHKKEPWTGKDTEKVLEEIIADVERLVLERGEILPGVHQTIEFFREKELPVALASSSPMGLIESFVGKMGIRSHLHAMRSGDQEEYSKPHPAIFINVAKEMGVDPKRCLVFEDSVNGVIAAKAAGMKTVAIPEAEMYADARFSIADMKLASMADFGEKQWLEMNRY
ncbi:2-deoxyglucose-6-phosphatase [Fulvitalea axinellae]|uniref:2-deoxyglucose-6-phosphatase n=1 Tax=Fulvitalea axinellae TaxID=1182444 RepID=A0AAU9CIA5_9BACT|nr:2-deoxyglucose-6-phosphatase [Fulvitalea axinellae]